MVGMDTTILKVGWFKYVMNQRFTKRGKCRGIITVSTRITISWNKQMQSDFGNRIEEESEERWWCWENEKRDWREDKFLSRWQKSNNPFDCLEEKMSRGTIEDVAIIGGLVGVQFIYAGNAVFMGYALSLGFSSLTIIILTSLATFLVLFPVSFFFERFFLSASTST